MTKNSRRKGLLCSRHMRLKDKVGSESGMWQQSRSVWCAQIQVRLDVRLCQEDGQSQGLGMLHHPQLFYMSTRKCTFQHQSRCNMKTVPYIVHRDVHRLSHGELANSKTKRLYFSCLSECTGNNFHVQALLPCGLVSAMWATPNLGSLHQSFYSTLCIFRVQPEQLLSFLLDFAY